MNYFDIKRDSNYPYWCQSCLVGTEEVSEDPRYCPRCYDLLVKKNPDIITPLSWSYGGQVNYVDGYAWVVQPDLTSARVDRAKLEKALKEGTDDSLLNKVVQSDAKGIARSHQMDDKAPKHHYTTRTSGGKKRR